MSEARLTAKLCGNFSLRVTPRVRVFSLGSLNNCVCVALEGKEMRNYLYLTKREALNFAKDLRQEAGKVRKREETP